MSDVAPKTYQAGTLTYTKGALVILFGWLLWGDFCFILMETVVPGLMPLKFKALGAPNTIIALVITTIPGIINTILNPIISFRSDRYRSRWGRRIPFIVVTLPFLVLCLVGLAFGDRVGFWLHGCFAGLPGRFSPNAVAIALVGTVMALFSFFNTFVNSVFWYLFNDVVPEHLLARFMSWFRMVSMGSAGLYNLVLFKHAGTHSAEILTGVGALYFVGFGLMCLNVKEGQYPPPPEYVEGGTGIIAAIKTYCRECLGFSHYWFAFLASAGVAVAVSGSIFTIFFLQSIGLDFDMVGKLAFAGSVSGAISIPIFGWLADKFHPIRIVMAGVMLQILTSPIYLIWLFWQPSPSVVFYVLLASGICLGGPIGAMISMMDPPLFMRIFPRERYGQFCSANSMIRSLCTIVAGMLVGGYLDVLTSFFGARTAYCCLPLWSLTAYAGVLFCVIKLYRSWMRYGGDEAYVPPVPSSAGSG
ncbi:MAG: MFS transporter [Chthoniobacteraceae bacterium]